MKKADSRNSWRSQLTKCVSVSFLLSARSTKQGSHGLCFIFAQWKNTAGQITKSFYPSSLHSKHDPIIWYSPLLLKISMFRELPLWYWTRRSVLRTNTRITVAHKTVCNRRAAWVVFITLYLSAGELLYNSLSTILRFYAFSLFLGIHYQI